MKIKSQYICSNCGVKSTRWLGKCFNCDTWDSFTEVSSEINSDKKPRKEASVKKLSEISDSLGQKIPTGINELDRCLGGGIIPGSLILIAGEPGIGKSTLMLQAISNLQNLNPLYISGEESENQIKFRSSRIVGIDGNINISTLNDFDSIQQLIESKEFNIIVVDSIQSVFIEEIKSVPGSLIQVRECTFKLMELSKKLNIPIFIIGHITKDGTIAGPKSLEHLVDTVIQFESDKGMQYRILRTLKNRFGPTGELGIFEMSAIGLIEVKDSSKVFLSERNDSYAGIAYSVILEGTRCIPIEIQTLVSETGFSIPQRISSGFDPKKLQMILSILDKKLGIKFYRSDVFLNIAGGFYINDPAVDIAICACLISSYENKPLASNTIFLGELSLTGEVKSVSFLTQRLKEANKISFDNSIIPNQIHDLPEIKNKKIKNLIEIYDSIF